MAAEKWELEKGAGACASCGREFVPGDARLSGLYAEEGALVRRDYCAECWRKRAGVRPGNQPGNEPRSEANEDLAEEFSHWRTVVPEPEEADDRKRRLSSLVDAETLLDILRDTPDGADPQKTRFRFVIALMLMRRKKLKLVSITPRPAPDGSGPRDVLVLKKAGRGQKQVFEVADVKMSEEEMISAQDEVGTLLGISGGADAEAEEADQS